MGGLGSGKHKAVSAEHNSLRSWPNPSHTKKEYQKDNSGKEEDTWIAWMSLQHPMGVVTVQDKAMWVPRKTDSPDRPHQQLPKRTHSDHNTRLGDCMCTKRSVALFCKNVLIGSKVQDRPHNWRQSTLHRRRERDSFFFGNEFFCVLAFVSLDQESLSGESVDCWAPTLWLQPHLILQ